MLYKSLILFGQHQFPKPKQGFLTKGDCRCGYLNSAVVPSGRQPFAVWTESEIPHRLTVALEEETTNTKEGSAEHKRSGNSISLRRTSH
jgi:hypothetical protein